MTIREESISALNKLALSGNVNALADAYSDAAIPQDKQDIETSLVTGIEVCGRHGRVDDVANLLRRTGLSDTVMVAGIEVCGRDGWIGNIADLLGRTDLSDVVMVAGIEACGRNGRVEVIANLFGRTDLSDTVRTAAQSAISQAKVLVTDIVAGYMGRNPLACGGVIPEGTIKPPKGNAPASSKPRKVTV